MDSISSSFSELMNRFGDVYFYGALITAAIVFIFVGRLVLRSMVNKRVHGVSMIGMTFGDIERMKKEGLISEAEYKEIRHKMAKRELEAQTQEKKKLQAGQILAAIEADPSLATTLLPPGSERAKAALANRSEAPLPSPPPAIQQQRTANRSEIVDLEHSVPPEAATSPVIESDLEDEEYDTDPLRTMQSPPSPTARAPQIQTPAPQRTQPQPARPPSRPASAAGPKKQLDIDSLLAKGLISKDEYDRLAELIEQSRNPS
jgi:hypothetical protein